MNTPQANPRQAAEQQAAQQQATEQQASQRRHFQRSLRALGMLGIMVALGVISQLPLVPWSASRTLAQDKAADKAADKATDKTTDKPADTDRPTGTDAPQAERYFGVPFGDLKFTAEPALRLEQLGEPWERRVTVMLQTPGVGFLADENRWTQAMPARQAVEDRDEDADPVAAAAAAVADAQQGMTVSRSMPQPNVLYVRAPAGDGDIVGRIGYEVSWRQRANSDAPTYAWAEFRIPASAADPKHRQACLRLEAEHYRALAQQGTPGAAWFRYQHRHLQRQLTGSVPGIQPDRNWAAERDLDQSFSLFDGTRAVSENLQLDRALQEVNQSSELKPLAGVAGVTVQEIDWKPLLEGKNPALDKLAASVPADQHVAFFPSFGHLAQVADEAQRRGGPLLQSSQPQSVARGIIARYERQLGLSLDGLARQLGPQVIRSVAITGGDSYFDMGTDVALLFEPVDPTILQALLLAQVKLAHAGLAGIESSQGERSGVTYYASTNADRTASSYLAKVGNAVVATNSLAQLERLIDVAQDKSPAIASLDEFRFFRDRYPLGEADEAALLFLSDATIRRWCSPRWRIADSRRVRDLAVLADLQASLVPKMAQGKLESGPIYADLLFSTDGDISASDAGVRHSVLGSLNFLTPINELELTHARASEVEAYIRWRDGYQRNFSWAFDPIALRLSLSEKRLAADMTVMPLIDATDYRELISVSRGSRLLPTSADPHNAPLQIALAINPESEVFKQYSGMLTMFAPQIRVDPLSWLGKSVSIYADESPLWGELAKLESDAEREKFIQEKRFTLPVAFSIEVSSAFKATAFLAAVRAFIDQVGPGMVLWEPCRHGEWDYVRIAPTERAISPDDPYSKIAIYYALTSELLVISLDEKLIMRVLDRQQARDAQRKAQAADQAAQAGEAKPAAQENQAAQASPAPTASWLGENLAVNIQRQGLDALPYVFTPSYRNSMQQLAWSNLPILNEWRQRYPDQDPVELHARLWGERLLCPGGGSYVWNDEWHTMESTIYGHQLAPKGGPGFPPSLLNYAAVRFGLTFEEQGLRSRVELIHPEKPADDVKPANAAAAK